MNLKKHIGFTLAELMVMLAVLTVLLAAFAPVFTVKYKNSAAENVWSFVNGDDEFDIYSNPISDVLSGQLFIGMQPTDKADVNNYLKAGSNVLYSKLVIRASNKLGLSFGSEKQKQFKFHYGTSREGESVGTMFAGNSSILLGGDYKKISDSATDNTAFGSGALDALTSGTYNTAFGTNAGNKLTTGKYNTIIGSGAGSTMTSSSYNTIVGYNAGTGSIGNRNTIIGNYSGTERMGDDNTIIGEYAARKHIGSHNTAIGYGALDVHTSAGDYNTAIGYKSMVATSIGSYNTAIGSDSCNLMSGASYKTCIGYRAGSLSSSYTTALNLFHDSEERIYIGTKPLYRTSSGSSNFDGAAVLEVHNINSRSGTYPITIGSSKFGDSSVVINGNLIVRGQPFMESKSYFYDGAPALTGFTKERPKDATHLHCFMGKDGSRRDARVPGRRGYIHAKLGGHTNCVCSRKCGADSDGVNSYDWTSRLKEGSSEVNGYRWSTTYTDLSLNKTCQPNRDDHDTLNIDINYAHGGANSCCPDLASDIRLKDLTTIFDDGLNAINRLTVYNYTYKVDEEQQPQVGVIAQDLKRVFPNAISKDKKGYYQIRWDEMLYASINAIKTLDSKIEALASRVSKDRARIATLKKDNANLEKKLNSLANELTELEKK